MKKLYLSRDTATDTEVTGSLVFDGLSLYTIERPWIPTDPGGKPFQYLLRPHTRRNGDEVVALVNPGLGVYYQVDDRPNDVGRYKCLFHSANWSHQLSGCIAPGIDRADSAQGPMVTSSRAAMRSLMEYIGGDAALIDIAWSNNDLQGD